MNAKKLYPMFVAIALFITIALAACQGQQPTAAPTLSLNDIQELRATATAMANQADEAEAGLQKAACETVTALGGTCSFEPEEELEAEPTQKPDPTKATPEKTQTDYPDESRFATPMGGGTDEDKGGGIEEADKETPEPEDEATDQTAVSEPCELRNYSVFDAAGKWNMNVLDKEAPSGEEFLKVHGLKESDIQYFVYPNDEDKDTKETWEPALFVIELAEDQYGKVTVPLLEGYAYTVALCDGTVQTFWGGNMDVREVTLLWGLSARWVPSYMKDKAGNWLSLENPEEWVTRENRFGRYRRSPESELPGLPYFDRWGPYNTLPGNVLDWNPPSLDAINPQTYLEAAAMLGGLARESEWTRMDDDGGWVWTYSNKVPGSGTYCKQDEPCWQTVYVPPLSTGCAVLWIEPPKAVSGGAKATKGGPYGFFASDLAILLDGDHQVDEFSYHPVTCPAEFGQ